MIGYLDYKDIMSDIFKDHDCVIEEPIAKLKGRKLGISFYEIIDDIIYDYVKQHSWEGALSSIKKKFVNHGIDTLFVMPGLKVTLQKDTLDAFWRIKHEWWKMELFKNLYSCQENTEGDSFLLALQDISDIYIVDAFTDFYATYHFKGFLVKIFTQQVKDSIVAPQMVGNQLLWLYDNSEVDAIMGNPTYFVYSGVDQLIKKVDYAQRKFYYYDLAKFAKCLNLTVNQTRSCINAAQMRFLLDEDLATSPKFLSASKNKVLEFKKNYREECEKRKKVFYETVEKMKAVLSGTETGMQLTKLISATLGLNKIDVTNYYNMFFKSPVITTKGEVLIYPEKRSLSKTFVLDTNCKELINFYSLGYVNDELFDLMNKCTNHTFSITPPRADSLESDCCITNFLLPHLKRSLTKVWMLCNKSMDQLTETTFNMRLQNGNLVPFTVEPEEIRLSTLYTANSHQHVSFYNCLNEFCTVLVKEESPVEIDRELSLSDNEMLFHAYLSLLQELKYINIKDEKVLVLGASLVKGGPSKFEEETILFFELFKLGIIKGDNFQPSNIENINKLTLERISGDATSFGGSEREEGSEDDTVTSDTQKEFLKALKNFEEFTTVQRSLTLYEIESSIDKVLVTFKQIKNQIYKERLANYKSLCMTMTEALSKKIHVINFLSKLFTLGDFKYVNPEKLTDYETHQFDQCLKLVSQTCYRALSASLLYVFMKTNTKHDLSIFDRAFRRLPFNYQGSPEVATIVKIVLTKFVVFKALEGEKYSYRHTLAAQIQRTSVEDSLDNKLNITDILLDRLAFIDHLVQICNYKKDSFEELIDSLLEARSFLQTYIDSS